MTQLQLCKVYTKGPFLLFHMNISQHIFEKFQTYSLLQSNQISAILRYESNCAYYEDKHSEFPHVNIDVKSERNHHQMSSLNTAQERPPLTRTLQSQQPNNQ